MTVVSAFLVPGSPLPYVQSDNPPWQPFVNGFRTAAETLARSKPDTIVIYSTQWLAVLDQLWLTRPSSVGVHVDENWHEYGELPFDVTADVELTNEIISATAEVGVRSKGVNYDSFPIDTGTIVAGNYLNPEHSLPACVTSNNLYHDWELTHTLGHVAARIAATKGRRIAVVGVGGLSGSFFRHPIDIAEDHIASSEDDNWNKKILDLLEAGKVRDLKAAIPDFAQAARADMGFKHCGFVLGALGDQFSSATIHTYGPLYGTGGAVVQFNL